MSTVCTPLTGHNLHEASLLVVAFFVFSGGEQRPCRVVAVVKLLLAHYLWSDSADASGTQHSKAFVLEPASCQHGPRRNVKSHANTEHRTALWQQEVFHIKKTFCPLLFRVLRLLLL